MLKEKSQEKHLFSKIIRGKTQLHPRHSRSYAELHCVWNVKVHLRIFPIILVFNTPLPIPLIRNEGFFDDQH